MCKQFVVVKSPTGKLKQVKIGFSYTTLIFSYLPDLFRGNFLNAFLLFAVGMLVTLVLNSVGAYDLILVVGLIVSGVYATVRNERLLDSYLKKGWVVKDVFTGER